jgi:methyl-accepting chemotaxis protein
MERATLERLASDAKIMKQSFISLQRQLLADGRSLALDPEVVRGVRGETVSSVSETAQRFLASRELSSVVILNEAGKVLVRGEEPDRVGESLSAEPLFVQAVKGEELVTVVTRDEPTRQSMWIYALAPVVVEKQVVGVVMLGQEVGQSMLDGVKASTGLEGALWSGNKLAAATFAGADTAMGIVETRDEVVEQVLTKGESIAKPLTVLSVPYFVAYEPIRDDDDVVVGMLSVGTTQAAVFQLAGESTALTFVVAIGLMLTMSGPSYWVARQLAYQLH